jgi:nitroreductase
MSATTEDLVRFVRGLRQVREYSAEPVSDAVVDDILEVGRWSGSSANTQPAEVLVVRDPEVKNKIGGWGAKPAATAAVVFLILTKNDDFGVDEGRLGERLMLASRAYGLGSSFATLKNEGPDAVKQLLGVPDNLQARVVISVGHIDAKARAARAQRPGPPRKPMAEFAHRDRY